MLERLIDFSLRRRGLIAFASLLLVAVGVWSAFRVAIDAVPDITSPQVQINTAVQALAPEEVETLVTVPIETEMAGLPGMVELRSLSKFGLSQVTMTFHDGSDIYRLRQLVTERLARAPSRRSAPVWVRSFTTPFAIKKTRPINRPTAPINCASSGSSTIFRSSRSFAPRLVWRRSTPSVATKSKSWSNPIPRNSPPPP